MMKRGGAKSTSIPSAVVSHSFRVINRIQILAVCLQEES